MYRTPMGAARVGIVWLTFMCVLGVECEYVCFFAHQREREGYCSRLYQAERHLQKRLAAEGTYFNLKDTL